VAHLKQDLANLFEFLRREGAIDRNPVEDAKMPKFPREVVKERAVLTDEELRAYLDWKHPDSRY
jgi:site-specific recombinase XerC